MPKNSKEFKVIIKGEFNDNKTSFKSCHIEADINDDETLPIDTQALFIQSALYLHKVIEENVDVDDRPSIKRK